MTSYAYQLINILFTLLDDLRCVLPSNDFAASFFTTRPRNEERERKEKRVWVVYSHGVYYRMVLNKKEVMQLEFSFPERKERRVHQRNV